MKSIIFIEFTYLSLLLKHSSFFCKKNPLDTQIKAEYVQISYWQLHHLYLFKRNTFVAMNLNRHRDQKAFRGSSWQAELEPDIRQMNWTALTPKRCGTLYAIYPGLQLVTA